MKVISVFVGLFLSTAINVSQPTVISTAQALIGTISLYVS